MSSDQKHTQNKTVLIRAVIVALLVWGCHEYFKHKEVANYPSAKWERALEKELAEVAQKPASRYVYPGQSEIERLIQKSSADLKRAGYDSSKGEAENFVAGIYRRLDREFELLDRIAATGDPAAKRELAKMEASDRRRAAEEKIQTLHSLQQLESANARLLDSCVSTLNNAKRQEQTLEAGRASATSNGDAAAARRLQDELYRKQEERRQLESQVARAERNAQWIKRREVELQ